VCESRCVSSGAFAPKVVARLPQRDILHKTHTLQPESESGYTLALRVLDSHPAATFAETRNRIRAFTKKNLVKLDDPGVTSST